MRRIKVAHIITDLDTGGAELMLLKTLRNFKSDRYSHFVISLLPRDSLREGIEKEGFNVYQLNINRGNIALSFVRLISVLRRERPQIVHNYLFHADILGRIAAKVAGVPIVISSLRNENIGGRLYEVLLRMTDFCVDGVTAVSENVADVHILKGTTKKTKISVIYNGLELGCSCPKDSSYIRRDVNIGDDTSLLLTVGNLEAKKGHIFLFEACKVLKEKGYKLRLLVVGSGREKKRLESKIDDLRLENEVVLTGRRSDVPELLAASDIFILPSLWEGLPNALLEAMEAGLPVVATRVGGVPELVTDDETGLLVDAEDGKALAEAVERIIRDSDLGRRLSQNAKEYVKRKFDIKNTVMRTEKLYEELLRQRETD